MSSSIVDFLAQCWFQLFALAVSLASLAYSLYVYHGMLRRLRDDDNRDDACKQIFGDRKNESQEVGAGLQTSRTSFDIVPGEQKTS